MMLAAFGAVHGNLATLNRVLDAIEDEGIQSVVCTGNCALGPNPNQVIDLIRSRNIPIVQGLTDRLLARLVRKRKRLEREVDAQMLAALESAHRICTSANLEWLAGLPHMRTLTIDGESIVLLNGTIASGTTPLQAGDPDQNFRRQREVVPARVFVCGGGPQSFARTVDNTLFADPGPVLTSGSADVRYAVISTESEPPHAAFRAVAIASNA